MDSSFAALVGSIPFNAHLGLQGVEVGVGRAVVRLPYAEHLYNHVGSQHAAGLFAVAEAASGAAVVGTLHEDLGSITPLVKRAEISFAKVARGEILATATLSESKEALRARIAQEGRAETSVLVELRDARSVIVATMTVTWHLRSVDFARAQSKSEVP